MFHIKTCYHPSGRYTCMARHENEKIWKDLPGELFGNLNRTSFYEAVGQHVEKLRAANLLSEFDDIAYRVGGHAARRTLGSPSITARNSLAR